MDEVSSCEIGVLCLIYSRSKNRWFVGQIIDIVIDSNTNDEWLTVKYDKKKKKKIQRYCDAILPWIDLNDSKIINLRSSLNIGSVCQIFSESDTKWYYAKVTKTFTHPEAGKWLTVKYNTKTLPKTNNIQPYSHNLQLIDFNLNELILHKRKKYILPRNKALKFENVNISNCALSLSDQGILSIESDNNITFDNCIIDLSGKDSDIVNNYAYYDMTRDINQIYVGRGCGEYTGGSALRLYCNELIIKHTQINISGQNSRCNVAENGSILLICNELITDDRCVINCKGKGGRIAIKINNFLSKRQQLILIYGYWRDICLITSNNILIIDEICNLCDLFLMRDEWLDNICLNICADLSENTEIYIMDNEWNKRISERTNDFLQYYDYYHHSFNECIWEYQDLRVIYEQYEDLIIEPITVGYKMPKHPSKIPHNLWNL